MARNRLGFLLHAWVIMPEHVHLVVLPTDGAIAPVLRSLKQGFSQAMIREWRDTGDPRTDLIQTTGGVFHFWQRGGGYDRNIRSDDELRRHVGYIHSNPVRRNLVERPEDWRWSSYAAWHGFDAPLLPDRLT